MVGARVQPGRSQWSFSADGSNQEASSAWLLWGLGNGSAEYIQYLSTNGNKRPDKV